MQKYIYCYRGRFIHWLEPEAWYFVKYTLPLMIKHKNANALKPGSYI